MKAMDVMSRPVYAARQTTSAREIAVQMLECSCSGLPIVDDEGSKVVGLVTMLDVIKAFIAGKPLESTLAAEIMTPDVITVEENMPIEEVVDLLVERSILRVPVTQGGSVVGVISRSDIVKAMLDEKPAKLG